MWSLSGVIAVAVAADAVICCVTCLTSALSVSAITRVFDQLQEESGAQNPAPAAEIPSARVFRHPM